MDRHLETDGSDPVRVVQTLGGVTVCAQWSDAMAMGVADDVGRYAAALCLGQLDDAAAERLAVMEGLCSNVTSLVLIDEAGALSDGISETRKIPLMDADDDGQLGDFIEDRNTILPLPCWPTKVATSMLASSPVYDAMFCRSSMKSLESAETSG